MRNAEFPQAIRKAAWSRCDGICECGCSVKIRAGDGPEYHHILEDWLGGEPTLENCMVVRATCHKAITKARAASLAKTRRLEKARKGLGPAKRPFPGGKNDKWKAKVGGRAVLRSEEK